QTEHYGEDRGAEQDDEHHGGDGRGADAGLVEHAEGEPPACRGQDHGAHGTDRGGFGGGGDAAEDGAQHGDDEQQRRHQGDQYLAQQVLALIGRNRRRWTGFG